ncbi:hypothetical protein LVIS_1079 [Levilactobacillus brevis ATCC 367]|uniref:Uncharacterized protein n=1 Tax=Levilactobacillus brevis (strain ATCC 367 / BCRC 12310 / CIP 105137 / JCM 1170 / LMG 11437 / NCIMB 947 / NCTC 947) TaxID=387344 RepID=Q03RG1_LEVBA|nr:hypothetical protein [Levilactobacillus brevis]ABJ64211.1 hypothetical protein LVIS_1079 [Levilactobacillus brevis ATCC 367]
MGIYIQGGKKVGGMYMADGRGNATKIGGMYYADGKGNAKKIYYSFLPAGTILYDGSSQADWDKLYITGPQQYQLTKPLEKLKNGIKVTYGDAYYGGVPGYNADYNQGFIKNDHTIKKLYPISQLNNKSIRLNSMDILGRVGNTAGDNEDGEIKFNLTSSVFSYKSPDNLWLAWTATDEKQPREYAPILKIEAY